MRGNIMEQIKNVIAMLDFISGSAFCVENGVIIGANEAARRHNIITGTAVQDLLLTGKEEYASFTDGCLYLTLNLSDLPYGASVTRVNGIDIFQLQQESDQADLQMMALAAQELRQPLSSVMAIADSLFPITEQQVEPDMQDQAARINRGLFQMLRIISNMSDAYRYNRELSGRQETRDICAVIEEVFQNTADMVEHTGTRLHFTGLKESIYCLVDQEKLERAINNILSNALKFSPKGSTIEASLKRKEKMLYLTVQDNGSGIHEQMRSSLYNRYRREPGIEDSRHGIGLGMVLIRSAAAAHGGAVLLENNEQGTRLTMTLRIRQSKEPLVRTGILRVDYAGERDHRLLEFSDSLPASLYTNE